MFNLGDGGVFDYLKEIGIKNIEWVIFSDHHREQCQGAHRIDRNSTKLAAPKEEQALFQTLLCATTFGTFRASSRHSDCYANRSR